MDITFDLFVQLEDLYEVKARHLGYLNALLPDGWQTAIPGGYGGVWEQRDWKFVLRGFDPFPRALQLLIPGRRQLLGWTMIGFTNEIIMEVSPESLGGFLESYIGNPAARRNLAELFLGEDMLGAGMKAFGSLVVCAREENRFLDQYLPLLRAFGADDPREVGIDADLKDTATGFFREVEDFRRYLDSDVFIHRRFSKDLKVLFRERVSVGILGYGEISSVLSLAREGVHGTSASQVAYKKMPPFPDRESIESYVELFDRYHEILKEIGLSPPKHGIRQVNREDGTVTVFATQTRLPAGSLVSNIVRQAPLEELVTLFRMVLEEALKVAEHNRAHQELAVGIDIRISNWGVGEYSADNPRIRGDEKLYYVDTSTPFMREGGQELLDPGLFLATMPFFIRGTVKSRYLKEMLDRYYDSRGIVVDLVADFITEGRPEAVPLLVEEANRFFRERMSGFGYETMSEKEVRRRYRRDRRARAFLRVSRRLDRFVQTKILRRSYPYRLPE